MWHMKCFSNYPPGLLQQHSNLHWFWHTKRREEVHIWRFCRWHQGGKSHCHIFEEVFLPVGLVDKQQVSRLSVDWSEHVSASFICNMMSSSSHTSCAEFKTSEADFVLGGEENLSSGDSCCMYGQILFFKGHPLHSDNLLLQTFFFVHGESPHIVFQFILVCQYEQHRCSLSSNPQILIRSWYVTVPTRKDSIQYTLI